MIFMPDCAWICRKVWYNTDISKKKGGGIMSKTIKNINHTRSDYLYNLIEKTNKISYKVKEYNEKMFKNTTNNVKMSKK